MMTHVNVTIYIVDNCPACFVMREMLINLQERHDFKLSICRDDTHEYVRYPLIRAKNTSVGTEITIVGTYSEEYVINTLEKLAEDKN